MSENPFATETTDDNIRLDATLVNVLTQMGTGGDRSEYTTVGRGARIPKQQLEDLYRVPICRRVVNARPNSAILKGWNLTLGSESDQKIVSKFAKYSDRLKLKNKFRTAQVQANIYGGAVLVVAAEDGKDPRDPLDEKKISTISSLQVLDRYKIQPVLNFGIDPEDPEFYRLLLPEFLQRKFNELFPNGGKDFLIHSSRIIRFDGVGYTSDMLWDNEGWGGSVLESLWEDYRDWKTALKAISAMVQDCSVFVYKLKGLAQMIKGQDENLLKSRLKLMRMMISVFGGFAADAEGENVEFPSRNFGGIDQVANQLRDAFIGATGIPHDRLFGESPSGLGATGESEEKNWASDVASFQQTEWLPKLLELGRKIFLAKDGPSGGKEPLDWGFEFPSLLQQSEADIASNRSTQASTDNTYISTGVLLPEEVRASRFGGSKYSIETVLDNKLFAKKQKEAEQQQQFGDFGGEEPPPEEPPPEETTNQDSVERYDALYSQLPKDEEGRVKYLGKWWHINKPIKSDRQGKKRMVLAKKGDRVKLVHYGASGYEHNYSESAKHNYLTRSAGIKDKNGNPTKDDPFSPNHWARIDLWNKKLPADGSTLYQGNGKGKKCGDGYTSAENECRKDAADPAKKIVSWNGLSIGVTHEPGDTRFPLSRPMQSSYGHLRRSYGDAPDGKAIDVYLGDCLESPQAYKVRQLDPKTGMPDEDKYFIGFEDAAAARDCFTYHAGRDRFGGIEPINQNELQIYRQDNCSDRQPRLSTGVQTFNTKLFTNSAPTSEEILQIVQATFPESVLKLGDWKYKADGTADGEFYTPLGVYGFGIKNNYCGYAWRRELNGEGKKQKSLPDSIKPLPSSFTTDSDPVRSGYTWVNDKDVKNGGYWRKGEPHKYLAHKSTVGPGTFVSKKLFETRSPDEAKALRQIVSFMDTNIASGIDSIKRVHSLSGLPKFDIELSFNPQKAGQAGEMISRIKKRPFERDAKLAFDGISLNLATTERLLKIGLPSKSIEELVQLTVIHEMGHAVDLTMLGSKNRFASAKVDIEGNNLPDSAEKEVVPLMTKLRNSQGAAKIRLGAGADPNLKAYSDYLLTDNELFARAYTQYITTKAGDRDLMANIQNHGISIRHPANQSPLGHGHWDSEEFNSTIMPEFDRIFANKGLLK